MKLIDSDTGEVFLGLAVYLKKRYPREIQQYGFMTMFRVAWDYLASIDDLAGRDYRVFHRLLAQLEFENWISISQQTIAEDLNIHQQDVAKSIKKLTKYQIIEQQKDPSDKRRLRYRFNPAFGWMGDADQWKKLMIEKKNDKIVPLTKPIK